MNGTDCISYSALGVRHEILWVTYPWRLVAHQDTLLFISLPRLHKLLTTCGKATLLNSKNKSWFWEAKKESFILEKTPFPFRIRMNWISPILTGKYSRVQAPKHHIVHTLCNSFFHSENQTYLKKMHEVILYSVCASPISNSILCTTMLKKEDTQNPNKNMSLAQNGWHMFKMVSATHFLFYLRFLLLKECWKNLS